ncbi:unnamed protein product [Cyprideis torosa]|uniref:Uncharacterized protein n=1 Tax=Cyprideis torosa TaxID=163714 RepID=A0A7R8WHZ1_9CRUS|nr:unnamed protein product [Cyprideis torosa]CAG0893885.1 unnamed protein product [Cyprideis torosa]
MATLVPIRSTEGGADRSLWRPSMTIVVSDAEIWTGIPRVLGCVRCAFCRGSSCCETVKSCHTPKMLRGLERTLRQTHGLARTLQQTHGELQRHCPQWHTRHTSTHAPSSIQYGAPESRDLQPVLELLQHAFTTREPITEGLRIEKKDFESWAPRCVEEMFEQNVSLVARDTSKDLLVGFQLTEIETPDSTTGLRGAAMRGCSSSSSANATSPTATLGTSSAPFRGRKRHSGWSDDPSAPHLEIEGDRRQDVDGSRSRQQEIGVHGVVSLGKLPKYDGVLVNFYEFWELFECAVDKNQHLTRDVPAVLRISPQAADTPVDVEVERCSEPEKLKLDF